MNVLLIVVCPLILFFLAIVLSVLFPYTDSDYPFGIFKLFLLPKIYLAFLYIDFEHSWWRLYWLWADEGYIDFELMKVILTLNWWRLYWLWTDEGYIDIELMKVILTLSWWRLYWLWTDEGYIDFELMKVILTLSWWRLYWLWSDEGYIDFELMTVILTLSWWRLFQKRVMCTKSDLYQHKCHLYTHV